MYAAGIFNIKFYRYKLSKVWALLFLCWLCKTQYSLSVLMMCMCIHVPVVANFPFWLAYLDDPSWQISIVITRVDLHVSIPAIYSFCLLEKLLYLSLKSLCFPCCLITLHTVYQIHAHWEVLTHAYTQIYTLNSPYIRTCTLVYIYMLLYIIHSYMCT